MNITTISSFVKCRFFPEKKLVFKAMSPSADVFFAQAKDFSSGISSIQKFINNDDQLKADRLHNKEDKTTILICYTLLRMVLSKRLKKNPDDIAYLSGINSKPRIKDDQLFFSISHTRNSFAFAISEQYYIGVDLEELNEHLNFEPIIKRFFSEQECNYILNSTRKARSRFFLLWTRKEALLKAIGTGIIPSISQIEVFRPVNLINRNSIDDLLDSSISDQHYIYSRKLNNCYLSVALPQKAKIKLYHLNEKYLDSYFSYSKFIP